jgi:hypothetical protein
MLTKTIEYTVKNQIFQPIIKNKNIDRFHVSRLFFYLRIVTLIDEEFMSTLSDTFIQPICYSVLSFRIYQYCVLNQKISAIKYHICKNVLK